MTDDNRNKVHQIPASASLAPLSNKPPLGFVRVIVVLEGMTDVELLKRLAGVLYDHDSRLPDLTALERAGELVFVPIGGGNVASWTERLAPLGRPEFHLYDREKPPETELRRQAVARVNDRPGCQAFLTSKRALENYLHPDALIATGGPRIRFGDDDDLPERVAQYGWGAMGSPPSWERLLRQARRHRLQRAKQWLSTRVVEHMTPEMLVDRDPSGEVLSWLTSIAELAKSAG